jgi:hypothetical protein
MIGLHTWAMLRNATEKKLVVKPDSKRPHGKARHRWKNNTEMNLKDIW